MRDRSHLLLVIHLRSREGIKMCRLFCELLACELALLALQPLVQKSQLICDPLPTTRGRKKRQHWGGTTSDWRRTSLLMDDFTNDDFLWVGRH